MAAGAPRGAGLPVLPCLEGRDFLFRGSYWRRDFLLCSDRRGGTSCPTLTVEAGLPVLLCPWGGGTSCFVPGDWGWGGRAGFLFCPVHEEAGLPVLLHGGGGTSCFAPWGGGRGVGGWDFLFCSVHGKVGLPVLLHWGGGGGRDFLFCPAHGEVGLPILRSMGRDFLFPPSAPLPLPTSQAKTPRPGAALWGRVLRGSTGPWVLWGAVGQKGRRGAGYRVGPGIMGCHGGSG